MNLKIQTRKFLPCSLAVFKINGKDADSNDFVEVDSNAELEAESEEEHVCYCFCVKPIPMKQKVLDKYSITVEEYDHICDELCSELFVGECDLCL